MFETSIFGLDLLVAESWMTTADKPHTVTKHVSRAFSCLIVYLLRSVHHIAYENTNKW